MTCYPTESGRYSDVAIPPSTCCTQQRGRIVFEVLTLRKGLLSTTRVDLHLNASNMPDLVACIIVMFIALGRLVLISLGWPATDSDESTFGLMARHIAFQGAHPGFFYGQNYMAPLESYIAAPLFHIFGSSIFSLRLGSLLLYLCFITNMYLLTALLYSKRFALLTMVLLGLGTNETLFLETEVGGHVKTLLFGSSILLLASWLVLSPAGSSVNVSRKRKLAYFAWAVAVGLGLWSDLLVLPFVIMTCLLLLICRHREVFRWQVLSLALIGIMLGAFPLIAYNLTAAPGQNSLSVLLQLDRAGGAGSENTVVSLGQQIAGTLLVSLPNITEAQPICPVTIHAAWPPSIHASNGTLFCSGVRLSWGLVAIAIWGIAVFQSYLPLRRLFSRQTHVVTLVEKTAKALYAARLAVLGSAGITFILFVFSTAPARDPWAASRYLIGLLIAVPACLSPLRLPPNTKISRWTKLTERVHIARYPIFCLFALSLVLGTLGVLRATPQAQARQQEQFLLVQNLEHIGATKIYTDYWTCDRIAFQSNERIICAVLNERLQPGQNRYFPYYRSVQKSSNAAFVFPMASTQAKALAKAQVVQGYKKLSIADYVVYQPQHDAASP